MERGLQRSAQNVDSLARQLVHPKQQLRDKREKLQVLSKQLKGNIINTLNWQNTSIEQKKQRLLTQLPNKQISLSHTQLNSLSQRLQRAQGNLFTLKDQSLRGIGEQLHTVSPLATLQRGFSITQDKDEQIIRSIKGIKVGDAINVKLSDGDLDCDITSVTKS